MRIVPVAFVASIAVLAVCGGADSSRASNAQASIGSSRPDSTGAASMLHKAAFAPAKVDLDAVMKQRHEGMETIGKNFKALHRELGGTAPDAGVVRASAAKINQLAYQAADWFPKGTGPERGKTGAKPEIWQNAKDFGIKLHNFQVAALRFNAAATGNDPAAIKARFADLGGTCKACHDKYRSEMHH